jgi:hypothetical protein
VLLILSPSYPPRKSSHVAYTGQNREDKEADDGDGDEKRTTRRGRILWTHICEFVEVALQDLELQRTVENLSKRHER